MDNPVALSHPLARDLGGIVEPEDPHAIKVRGTRLGNLSVELDLRHIHPARHPDLDLGLGRRGAAVLGNLISPFVPRELITAPIPATQLGDVDKALASLRSVGAR